MPELQQLRAGHESAISAFELQNRAYFAASISDRGDAFYADVTERILSDIATQSAGTHAFFVYLEEDGQVLGRFNLYDIKDGAARVGYRVAEHAAGRGVATAGAGELCRIAAMRYGLNELTAAVSHENVASQKVLARIGFIPISQADPAEFGGKQGMRYRLDLRA
ncbi:MAG TPA: GNAT family N-acetyltransferase [Jatrophihabitans sp.]|nr:GNAT family N-acetyltransferase [Jatrophihabitans sp.]